MSAAAVRKSAIAVGELLWDVFPDGRRLLGGAPANVAYRLTHLGVPTTLISRVGDDALGRDAIVALRSHGLSTAAIQRDSKRLTGTVQITLSTPHNPTYVVGTNAAYDALEPSATAINAARGASLVCFGTVGQRTAAGHAALVRILAAASRAIRFLDVNLRRDCFSSDTLLGALNQAHIVKFNQTEGAIIARTMKWRNTDARALCEQLMGHFNLRTCLMTRGQHGAYALSQSGEEISVAALPVHVVDSIGAGDAFVAAFARCLLDGDSLPDAMHAANRFAASVVCTPGGMSPVRPIGTGSSATAKGGCCE